MASATTEEALRGQLAKLQAAYEDLASKPIPSTLKEARTQRWELALEGGEIAALLAYPPEQQLRDSRRALPLAKAVKLMQQLEEDMIKAMVPNPSELADSIGGAAIKSSWFGWRAIVFDVSKAIVNAIWDAITNPRAALSLTKQLLALFIAGMSQTLEIIAVPAFIKWIGSGLKERAKVEKLMRAACLPQRSGPRFRARRKTRR